MIEREDPENTGRAEELTEEAVKLVPNEIFVASGRVLDDDGNEDDCLILLLHHSEEGWTFEVTAPTSLAQKMMELGVQQSWISEVKKKGGN